MARPKKKPTYDSDQMAQQLIVFAYVGRIIPIKGVRELVDAFTKAERKKQNSSLLVAQILQMKLQMKHTFQKLRSIRGKM